MKNMFIAIVVVVMLFGCSGNQSTFDVDYKKDSPTINNNITIVTNAELKKAQSNIFRAQFNNDRENVSSVNTHQEEVKYDRDTTGNIISSIHTSVVSIEEPFVIRENFKNGRYLLEKGKLRNFMEAIIMYMIKIDEIMKSKQSKDYEMDIHVLGTADGSFSRVIYNGDYGKNILIPIIVDGVNQTVELKEAKKVTNIELAALRALYGKKILEDALEYSKIDRRRMTISKIEAREYSQIGKIYRKVEVKIIVKQNYK